MPADWLSVADLVLSWVATYLAHSTLLVAAVWGFLKTRPASGHWLRDMLWKTALVGGLATASAQVLLLPAGPLGSLTWMLPSVAPPSNDSLADEVASTGEIEVARPLSRVGW